MIAGRHSADNTADQQDKGFTGNDLVDGVFERGFGLSAEHLGKHHGDEDRRDFHGRHDGWHEFFVADVLLIEEGKAGHEGDC